MEKINLQLLRPNPTILQVDGPNDDHEVVLTFSAKSEGGSGKANLLFVVATADPNVFVLSGGSPAKTLLFEIDVTERWASFEKKVTLRVLTPPSEAKPFGIAVLNQSNALGTSRINSISYIMVYEKAA